MTQYYFVTASLPALQLDGEPEMHLEEFLALCTSNLTSDDMKKLRKIQQLIDIVNLAALWRGEPVDRRGSLTAAGLEEQEAIAINTLPAFVFDFLDKYPSTPERIRHHGWLVAKFFQEAIPTSEGFLHDYFVFERELRLQLVALRAKELGRDLRLELQWEDPRDPAVALLLAGGQASALDPIFAGNERNPLQLHRQLELFRFGNVSTMVEDETFSLDAILGYMVQLMIAERLYEIEAA